VLLPEAASCADTAEDADLDRIHLRTAAIPESREARKPLALDSSSIVSDRLLLVRGLNEFDEDVVVIELVDTDVLLFPVQARLRDKAVDRVLVLGAELDESVMEFNNIGPMTVSPGNATGK
jgi:hypothetical protein